MNLPDLFPDDHSRQPAKGRTRSKHEIRPAGPSPDDSWGICVRAIRHDRGPKKGQVIVFHGKWRCYCECVDSEGKHRYDHEDLTHSGVCFFCGTRL